MAKKKLTTEKIIKAVFLVSAQLVSIILNAQTTYYSRADGNWTSSSTWSTVGFGDPTNSGSFPVAGDIALIGGIGYSISITSNNACASVSIGNSSSLTIGAASFTVSGTTTVGGGSSGGLFITANVGTKTFGGLVQVNTGATWSNSTEGVTFRGGISNSGTFNAGSGLYLFDTNSQTLTGNFIIPFIRVTGIGLVLAGGNSLTVNGSLNGTGALGMGSNSILNIGGASNINFLVATASGNTVNFTGGAQTVNNNSYVNLGLSGSGVKTLQSGTSSITGNLSLSGTASTTAVTAMTIGGSVTIGSGTQFVAGTFTHNIGGSWTNNGTFTHSNGTITFNGSSQTVGGSSANFYNLILGGTSTKVLGVSTSIANNLTINSGVVADLGTITTHTANALFLGGAVQGSGTWGSTSSTAAHKNDTYFANTGIVTITTGAFTYYSRASGNWDDSNTWSTVDHSSSTNTGTFPVAGDFAVIGGNFTVTVGTSASCTSLSYDAGSSVTNTLTINSGNTLNVSGAVTIPRITTSGANILNVGQGTLNAGSVSFTNGTTGGTAHRMVISTGTAAIVGNVTGSGTSSTIQITGAGLLQLGGSIFNSSNGTLTTTSGSTVEYNGTSQTVQALSYDNLTFSGSGNKTLAANTTVGGNVTIGNNTNLVIGSVNLTVTGTTTIGGGTSGSLTITAAGGTKIFTGLVTINNNGTWDSTMGGATFRGGITKNGTFTAGSGQLLFDTNAQTLTGDFIIPNLRVTGVSLINSNTLTVNTALSGTGALSQGSNAILNIGSTSNITMLVATASGNIVNFTGGDQTVNGSNYYNLNLTGSGIKTLQTGTTSIAGNLTLSGTISTTGANGITVGGTMTIGSGTTFTAGTFTHNIGGNWVNNGTFNHSGGTIVFNGTTQSITGATTFNNLTIGSGNSLTLASGAANVLGTITLNSGSLDNSTVLLNMGSGSNLVRVNGQLVGSAPSGGPYNLTYIGTSYSSGLEATGSLNNVSNNLTGSLTIASPISLQGDLTNNGVISDLTNPVTFNGSGAQSISGNSITYLNINVTNTAGSVSLLTNANLLGTLSLGATSTFNAGTGQLTLISQSDTQSASIGEIQSGATFTGSIIVQRFMGAEGAFNRYVSSPVTSALLSDLASNFALIGNKAKTYSESDGGSSSNGYSDVTLSSTLQSGKGYVVFPTSAYSSSNITWDVQGQLAVNSNQKNVNLNPTYTDHALPNDDGWNLLGNPYPSAIVWDGNPAHWDIQDIEPIVYVPDEAHPLLYFMSYDYSTGLGAPGVGTLAGGVIALGQGFWIKAKGPSLNPGLTVHESAKTSASGEFYRKPSIRNDGLSITLSDKIGKDVSWLLIKSDAENGYDAKYDRSKLEAPALSVSFLVEGRKLTNSTIRELTKEQIPLHVYGSTEGEYSISFEEVGNFSSFNNLVLVDRALGNQHLISAGPYTFHISGNTSMSDRFYLMNGDVEEHGDRAVSIFPNPVENLVTVKVFSREEAMVTIRDSNGANLAEGMSVSEGPSVQKATFDMTNHPSGIYLIQVRVGKDLVTRKIIKH